MSDSGKLAEETRELPAQRPGDWSWSALILAVVMGAAFVGGTYYGRTGRMGAPPTVSPPLPQAAAREKGPIPVPFSLDGYFIGANTSENRPARPPLALPASATHIYYHYALPGWPPDARIRLRWWLAGKELPSRLVSWKPQHGAPYPQGYFLLVPPRGATFSPGIYEVELSAPGQLTDTGSFAVVEGLQEMMSQEPPPGAVLVPNLVVALAVDRQGRPSNAVTQVPPLAPIVYACFSYDRAVPGTVLHVVWFCNGQEVPGSRSRIKLPAPTGNAYAFIRRTGEALLEGPWSANVYVEGMGKPVATAKFEVPPVTKGQRQTTEN